ncbi:MAG: hypothetical protein R3D28_12220 [Geminicoccaceae bacterium]
MSWVREAYYPSWQQSLRMDREVFRQQSPHQEILIFDNADLGRVLMLDGLVQATERDEFIYHESLVNLAWASHPAARRALVIGGGDGGCLRELVRHADLEAIDLVEIDAAVIDASRRHLPSIHRGAFDDRRVRTVIDDGAAFLERSGETYDLVLVDAPDPVGAGAALFTETFYRPAGGALVLPACSRHSSATRCSTRPARSAVRAGSPWPFPRSPLPWRRSPPISAAPSPSPSPASSHPFADVTPPMRYAGMTPSVSDGDAPPWCGARPGAGQHTLLPGRPAGPAHALPAMQTH